jgi:3-oxoacyl-[acyl-carrier protein] reductase
MGENNVTDRRVALVTGGSRGIGLGIARMLAKEGTSLAVNGVRDPKGAQAAVEELQASGAEVLYIQADISQSQDRHRLLRTIQEKLGRLDVLVNNAGVAPAVRADILEAGEESFERLVKINLQGPYFLTQGAASWMLEQRQTVPEYHPSIVFVTSVSATLASTNRGDYCITKAGLSMAAQLWATRLAEFDIPVYEVRPGIIRTDMTASVIEKYDRLIGEGLLLQSRWGSPDDVGKTVAALVRGDLPYSTGSIIMVDGGLTVPRL